MLRVLLNTNKWLSIIQFFFLGCVLGWIWEVVIYRINHQERLLSVITDLRGFLHGPWVPIYGVGCVLMLLLRNYFQGRPILFFLSGMTACGIIEFVTSWVLERLFHARWWDYSDQFMNLNGRICIGGLLFFGLAGVAVVYLLEPAFQKWMLKVPLKIRKMFCLSICLLFAADVFCSCIAPNFGMGVWIR